MLELRLTAQHSDGTSSYQNVFALVDSGASKTYLPLEVADQLGIRDTLVENQTKSFGLGAEFSTWEAHQPISAQIIATFPEPQGRTLIGPEVDLRPCYGDPDDSLLGRADFFQVFRITFAENPVKPLLTLEWPEALESQPA